MRTAFFLLSDCRVSVAPTPTPGGIASKYPGDIGIGYDPAVILADDFESYTAVDQLSSKWPKVGHPAYMHISTAQHYAGNKSLQITLPVSRVEISSSLSKPVSNDVLFMRMYQKWDLNYNAPGSNHNGIHMQGGAYPGSCIGTPANGTGWFIFCCKTTLTEANRFPAMTRHTFTGRSSAVCAATTSYRTATSCPTQTPLATRATGWPTRHFTRTSG